MKNAGRGDEKTQRECGKIEARLEQLEDPSRQARQMKLAYDIEEAGTELDPATGKACGIEVVGDRTHLEIDVFREERS
jgi:hypothetical protein